MTPGQAVSYVVACVNLHNLGIQTGDIVDKAEAFHPTAHQVGCNSQEGSAMRDYIEQTCFGLKHVFIYLLIDK